MRNKSLASGSSWQMCLSTRKTGTKLPRPWLALIWTQVSFLWACIVASSTCHAIPACKLKFLVPQHDSILIRALQKSWTTSRVFVGFSQYL